MSRFTLQVPVIVNINSVNEEWLQKAVMKRESGKVISPNSRLIMFQTSFYRRINLKALFPDPEASDPMQ